MPKRVATPTFPKILYVRRRGTTTGETQLDAGDTPTPAADGDRVAIYELRDIKTKRVTHTLSDLRKPGREAEE